MRRVGAVAVAVAIALLGACAAAPRPEGQVERWLRSLNQGAAGEPEQLAEDALSETVVPGWASREPESIDLIEVSTATSEAGVWTVPFSIHEMDGRTYRGKATVDPGADVPIVAVEPGGVTAASRVDHGVDGAAVWLAAVLLGLLIAAGAVGFVAIVAPRAVRAD